MLDRKGDFVLEMKNIVQYITAIPFVIIMVILFQTLGCKESNNDKYLDVTPKDKHQELEIGPMRDEAVRLANIKAEELGYNFDEMDIKVSNSGKNISVLYLPKQQPGVMITGGDLTVLINSESMEIIEIQRGQ